MRVAIIEAGTYPPELAAAHGTPATLIGRMLGDACDAYRAFDGQLPDPEAYDAFAVSGSACGVNDGLPWIDALTALVRDVAGRRRPLVGICFGHQLIARAFGGTVMRAPQGWGVGLHRYAITAPAPWMDDRAEAVSCIASHQDQVVAAPPGSTVHAASAFTPHAMLRYADHPTLTVQFHPEFTPGLARGLLELRRSPTVTDAQRAAAIASLAAPGDGARVAGWIRAFLKENQPAGRSAETRKPARSLVT